MGCAQGRENGLGLSLCRALAGPSGIPLPGIEKARHRSSLSDLQPFLTFGRRERKRKQLTYWLSRKPALKDF